MNIYVLYATVNILTSGCQNIKVHTQDKLIFKKPHFSVQPMQTVHNVVTRTTFAQVSPHRRAFTATADQRSENSAQV